MGDVIDFFTRQNVPAAEESDFVQEFTEGPLGDFLSSVEEMVNAPDEAEFKRWMQDVRYQVERWPT